MKYLLMLLIVGVVGCGASIIGFSIKHDLIKRCEDNCKNNGGMDELVMHDDGKESYSSCRCKNSGRFKIKN